MNDSAQIKIGSKTNPIVITLSYYKSSSIIDIRRYYLDKKSGEYLPTKKGIALQQRNFSLLLDALRESEKEINRWFTSSESVALQEAAESLVKRVEAQEAQMRSAGPVVSLKDSWRSPNFFEVSSEGASERLVYNERHPLYKQYLSDSDSNDSEFEEGRVIPAEILDKLLVSYHKAKIMLEGGGDQDPGLLFSALEYEWGMILGNYLAR